MKTISSVEPFQRERVLRNNIDRKNTILSSPHHHDIVSLDRPEDHSDASKEDKSWHTTNDTSEKEGTNNSNNKEDALDALLKRVEGNPILKEYELHDPRSLVMERSQGVWCLDDCLAWDESDDGDDN